MFSRTSRYLMRVLTAAMVVSAFAVLVTAQDDPDPDSPTPILLSENGSIRALAVPAESYGQVDVTRSKSQAFAPGSKIVLYLSNISLMKDEGANAFRVYAQDSKGHQYRFPVYDIDQSREARGVYALTTELRDELGFWDPPTADGDLAIYVAWRGLASNTVKLGFGQMGGGVGEIPGAVPTPIGTTAGKKTSARANSADFVGYRWSGDRMRFLEQSAFGPNPALDARIRRIGLRVWLSEQFSAPYPSANNPYPNQPLKTTNQGSDLTCNGGENATSTPVDPPDTPATCYRDTYSMYQPQSWLMREAFYGDAQLRHRVSWALAQLWVTSGVDVQQGRHMVEYHKILSNNAFGNYRTLMKQMTLNPAMGTYLNMSGSTRTNPNENYAREIMQLFTIGLFQLNQDGTLKLDTSNNPIPTYDQANVVSLTKVLTGWNNCSVGGTTCPNGTVGISNYIDPMIITNTNNHDITAKTLLTYPGAVGTNIAACTGCNAAAIQTYAASSMDQALDNIYNHPNVAPFVSRIMIQHLVTGDPTPAYVGRISAVFNANRTSPTQMQEVVKAILLDPEARGNTKTDPNYGKLREPVQFATNLFRAFNVRSADGLGQADGYVMARGEFNNMAQIPFSSPTVFNYYPPSYTIPGTALNGPEFAIMNTGTSIQRTNFINRFVFTAPAIPVSNPNVPAGLSLDFSDLQPISAGDATAGQLVDELNRRMLHGTMSTTMRTTIMNAVTAYAATDTLNRVRQAVYLVATSSQYQVQR